MSRSGRKPKRLLAKFLCIGIAATMSAGCSSLTKRSHPEPNPLLKASCPDLTPMTDDSFGATTLKLIEVSGIYYRCRSAALGTDKEGEK